MDIEEVKQRTVDYMNFIAGNIDIPVTEPLKRFIEQRSQKVDFLTMRSFYPTIKTSQTKIELIEFFCNLQVTERRQLIEANPQLIVAYPCDFHILNLELPKLISYRNPDRRSRIKELPVFSVLDLTDLYETTQHSAKSQIL